MSKLNAVLFKGFREYESNRAKMNDAIMALHVSRHLALGRLETQPYSNELASTLFPLTQDIGRLNLPVHKIQEVIEASERHFAYMAIPHVLAVHHEAIKSLQRLWLGQGQSQAKRLVSKSRPLTDEILGKEEFGETHTNLKMLTGADLPDDLLTFMEVARRVRNRIIHAGGVSGGNLNSELRNGLKSGSKLWSDWAGRPLALGANKEELTLDVQDVIAVLAGSTKLARLACAAVAKRIDNSVWADVAVLDFKEQSPRVYGHADTRVRGLLGFSRTYYYAVKLSRFELEDAISRERSTHNKK
ncbi:hypothetical protein [Pseudarthrobacter sp. S9]|uniref:hypothetical protein n=1 Tax=Pseudarthrobacter sp. S9 TaxID=3418421 RepID=UPI003D05FC56